MSQCIYSAVYNKQFVINFIRSLFGFIPLLIFGVRFSSDSFWKINAEILLVLMTTYLYSVIYAINDLIDFKRDRQRRSNKQSILSSSSSRSAVLPFLVMYLGVFAVLGYELPSLRAELITFVIIIVLLSILHSLWKAAKPGTLFMLRFSKWVSPFVLNYSQFPGGKSAGFIVMAVIMFPLIEHKNYLLYLKHKNYSSGMQAKIMKLFYTPVGVTFALISILSFLLFCHDTGLNVFSELTSLVFLIGSCLLWYGLSVIILKSSSNLISEELAIRIVKDPIYSSLLKELLVQTVMISLAVCTLELWRT